MRCIVGVWLFIYIFNLDKNGDIKTTIIFEWIER